MNWKWNQDRRGSDLQVRASSVAPDLDNSSALRLAPGLGEKSLPDNEKELVRRCAQGDERALREVFEAHEPRLRKLLYRNLGSREDAEELAATTFLRFWRSARRFRGTCSLKSYLTRIALNLCRDEVRKRRDTANPNPTSAIPHPTSDIRYPASLEDRIRDGLLALESDDRELLSLYYLDEWDYDEICESLGIGYDVLRTRLVRARKRLRQIVEEAS